MWPSMLNVALYEQLVIEHAAQSVFECEQADLLQGIKPPRKRTYAEGFEYGQSWARSLTLTRLLRLWRWSEVIDRQDSESCNALETWKAAYGKRYRNEDDCWDEIDAFWESDGLDADIIHEVSSEYSNGFFDGAVGVAQRVASNVP